MSSPVPIAAASPPQSNHQSNNHSTNQPTNPPTNQSTNQSTNETDLYQMIYLQLQKDGLTDVAELLAAKKTVTANQSISMTPEQLATSLKQSVISTDQPTNQPSQAPAYFRPFPSYVSPFTLQSKASIRCSAFTSGWTVNPSMDQSIGPLLAVGCDDRTVKLIDCSQVSGKSRVDVDVCIKATLYDHNDSVTDAAFHHYEPFLATSSTDFTVRFYDVSSLSNPSIHASQASFRRVAHTIVDHVPIRSISFHPSGDYLVTGCESPIIRLYDTLTMQAYFSDNEQPPYHFHRAAVNCVRFNCHGDRFVSASQDGTMVLFDTMSMKPIHTYAAAHSGTPVSSAVFHADGFSLLSSGRDSQTLEWDSRMHRVLHTYVGAQHANSNVPASYDSSAEFVLSADENTSMIHVWDRHSNNAEAVKQLPGHAKGVRTISALYGNDDEAITPGDGGMFVSGGEDGRTKIWTIVNEAMES